MTTNNTYQAGPANKLVHGFMALLMGLLTFIVAFMLSFYIACEVSPPWHIDAETGEKQMTMAMGQAFLALLIATVAGIAVFITALFYLRKKRLRQVP